MRKWLLSVGEPAPYFKARTTEIENFEFDTAGGRYIVMCFFGSAADPASRRVWEDFQQNIGRFDGVNVALLGISNDPSDSTQGRVRDQTPMSRVFLDFDNQISALYGAIRQDGCTDGAVGTYRPHSLVLDLRMRTLGVFPFGQAPDQHVPRLLEFLNGLPPISEANVNDLPPVLLVPRVFEPELCRTLIDYYDEHGGSDSGFMRQVDGRTVGITDHTFKRRRDQIIQDEGLRNSIRQRLINRLYPEIKKAFQYEVTKIERFIVACYDAAEGGFFRAHRDNTTSATAHRRFAVSINLNTGEYEGGRLRFPEFGRRAYAAPAGGAIVFSCSLLHEATPVTQGRRYAYLPFLFDEAAARAAQEQSRSVPKVKEPIAASQVST